MDKDARQFLLVIGILCATVVIGVLGGRWYNSIIFNQQCGGYLKLAADANSIELASERLDRAIKYIEGRGYTHGATSVFIYSPQNDVGQWYKNLKSAQNNLRNFPANPSETDVSTALVKLRETLLDHGEDGDVITLPDGIDVFPYNTLWFFLWIITIPISIVGLICLAVAYDP